MTRAEKIIERLEAAFDPTVLDLVDESEGHRGHAGFQEGGESHFRLTIKSDAFEGMSRIKQHRAIHTALGKDLIAEIHALAITVQS